MRGFIDKGNDDAAGNKYALNKPITSRTVAQVIESHDDNFSVGNIVHGRVGGELFDAVFANINKHGRIAICGQIAQYNADNPSQGPRPKAHDPRPTTQGPRPMQTLIKKSARMEGFVVYDFADEFDAAKKQIAEWYNNGQLKYKENLIEGFENISAAFTGLFSDENFGKQMIKTGDLQ